MMKCGRIVEVVYNAMPWNPIRHKYMQAFVVCIIFVYVYSKTDEHSARGDGWKLEVSK